MMLGRKAKLSKSPLSTPTESTSSHASSDFPDSSAPLSPHTPSSSISSSAGGLPPPPLIHLPSSLSSGFPSTPMGGHGGGSLASTSMMSLASIAASQAPGKGKGKDRDLLQPGGGANPGMSTSPSGNQYWWKRFGRSSKSSTAPSAMSVSPPTSYPVTGKNNLPTTPSGLGREEPQGGRLRGSSSRTLLSMGVGRKSRDFDRSVIAAELASPPPTVASPPMRSSTPPDDEDDTITFPPLPRTSPRRSTVSGSPSPSLSVSEPLPPFTYKAAPSPLLRSSSAMSDDHPLPPPSPNPSSISTVITHPSMDLPPTPASAAFGGLARASRNPFSRSVDDLSKLLRLGGGSRAAEKERKEKERREDRDAQEVLGKEIGSPVLVGHSGFDGSSNGVVLGDVPRRRSPMALASSTNLNQPFPVVVDKPSRPPSGIEDEDQVVLIQAQAIPLPETPHARGRDHTRMPSVSAGGKLQSPSMPAVSGAAGVGKMFFPGAIAGRSSPLSEQEGPKKGFVSRRRKTNSLSGDVMLKDAGLGLPLDRTSAKMEDRSALRGPGKASSPPLSSGSGGGMRTSESSPLLGSVEGLGLGTGTGTGRIVRVMRDETGREREMEKVKDKPVPKEAAKPTHHRGLSGLGWVMGKPVKDKATKSDAQNLTTAKGLFTSSDLTSSASLPGTLTRFQSRTPTTRPVKMPLPAALDLDSDIYNPGSNRDSYMSKRSSQQIVRLHGYVFRHPTATAKTIKNMQAKPGMGVGAVDYFGVGRGFDITKGWKPVQAVLQGNKLYLFKSSVELKYGSDAPQSHAQMNAEAIKPPVKVIGLFGSKATRLEHPSRPSMFIVETEDGATHLLQALMQEQLESWVSSVNRISADAVNKRKSFTMLPAETLVKELSTVPVVEKGETAVFGIALDGLLEREYGVNHDADVVPRIVAACLEEIENRGIDETGIYRIGGSQTAIKGLQAAFNTGVDIDLTLDGKYVDIHCITGVLKLYLRSLPNLIPPAINQALIEATCIADQDEKLSVVRMLVSELPPSNYALLKTIIRHLDAVAEAEGINHMTPMNLALIFVPSFFGEGFMTIFGQAAQLIKLMITDYHQIFETRMVHSEPPSPMEPQTSPGTSPAADGIHPGAVTHIEATDDSAEAETDVISDATTRAVTQDEVDQKAVEAELGTVELELAVQRDDEELVKSVELVAGKEEETVVAEITA